MKAWMKGAIVGAVWGLVSGVMWLGASMGGPLPTIWHKTILFPGFFSLTFFEKMGLILAVRIYLPQAVELLLFFGLSILVGIFIGVLITRIIELIGSKLINGRYSG